MANKKKVPFSLFPHSLAQTNSRRNLSHAYQVKARGIQGRVVIFYSYCDVSERFGTFPEKRRACLNTHISRNKREIRVAEHYVQHTRSFTANRNIRDFDLWQY